MDCLMVLDSVCFEGRILASDVHLRVRVLSRAVEAEITSTSAAAAKVLGRFGWTVTKVQGPLYWVYEGETLVGRQARLEGDAE